MSDTALRGLRVVELAEMVSGPYCGKLLADLGADVLKVEGPAGDAARRRGPFPPGKEGSREHSALFLYLNTSKEGVVLDLEREADRDRFAALVAAADVLIDNHPQAWLGDRGFGWPELERLNPRLVYTSITPYGRSGPRRDAPGDELTLIHAGGLGNLLPSRSEDVDRAPIKLGGYQVGYHGGLTAALATLAAIFARDRSGRGALVDVSLQEVMLAMVSPLVPGPRYNGTSWSRVPDRPPAMGRMATRDGYIILNAFDDHHFRSFVELMGSPEWCAGEEWRSMAYRSQHLMEIADRLEEWVGTQDKHALHRAAGERGIPIGPINTAEEVLAQEQYAARDYFVPVEHPAAGSYRYPGWPYRMSRSPARVSSPAPRLGEHAARLETPFVTGAGSGGASDDTTAPSGDLPLAGVRILEFCWVWAGPYAGRLLGALGAEVIKVESHRRTDLTRRSIIWPLPDRAPRLLPPNQGLAFNSVNLNKKSVTLDLSKPEGVELARRLASVSDVVVDNMRPGALSRLGLGPEELLELRPELVVASSSGRGRGGPETEFLGFAMVHQGIGGGAYISGYPDAPPCHSGGDVDLMNAMTLGYAILAALRYRRQTGRGQFIDYSQCEGVTSLLGEVLLEVQMTGRNPERCGNADPEHAPHGVYRAWGVDRWLAVEVHSDEEFARLAAAIGQPELAADERYATAPARKRHEAELDAVLAAWVRRRDRDLAARTLLAAGVKAAPSRNALELYADPHLRERGAFVTVEHPELGPLELVEAPWRISGVEMPAVPAPGLGEHNEEILCGLLGLSTSELAELRDEGVVAD